MDLVAQVAQPDFVWSVNVNPKLVDCEISYADVSGCFFDGSDMRACLMWKTETRGAHFRDIMMDDASDIPARKVVGGSMVVW